MKGKHPFVGIITLNYNHADDTIKCVHSIMKSTYQKFMVFLVDNGSTEEDSAKLYKAFQNSEKVSLIRVENNIGYVGGVNRGLKEAIQEDPDYFLIMNNDTMIDEEAIKELVVVGEKYEGKAIVSGKVYNMDEPNTLQYIGQYVEDEAKFKYPAYISNSREIDKGQFDEEMELGMTDDIFWLLPLEIFKKVGYYSTDFFLYGEQNDYVIRVKKAGFKLIYTPKSKIWHYHHLTTAGNKTSKDHILFWKNYALLLLIYKHLQPAFFISTYLSYNLKFFLKKIKYSIISNKAKTREISVWFTANRFFLKWLFGKRKPNDGFNPYL